MLPLQRTALASKKPRMIMINFRGEEQLYRRLQRFSRKHGVPISVILRNLITDLLKE